MGNERATQRRVKFDFEVDFSNGGGLQGQDPVVPESGQS